MEILIWTLASLGTAFILCAFFAYLICSIFKKDEVDHYEDWIEENYGNREDN